MNKQNNNENRKYECKAPDCHCNDEDYCVEKRKVQNKQIINTKNALNGEE